MTGKSKKAEFQPGRGYSKTDWNTVFECPEATDEQLAEAKPFEEVFPKLAEKMRRSGHQPARA